MSQTSQLYGGSLYELAAEEQLTETIMQQMIEIRQLFWDNPDYVRLLLEPSISKDERTGLIETAFGAQAERYLINFIKILCERNILGEYPECVNEFVQRYNADHGITEAFVTSAVALSKEQEQALAEKLARMTGKKVNLVTKVDPAVVGGLRGEIEGKLYDGTVSTRLSGFSRKLNEMIV